MRLIARAPFNRLQVWAAIGLVVGGFAVVVEAATPTSQPTSRPTSRASRSRWNPDRPVPPPAPPDASRYRFVDPPAKTLAARNLVVIIHGWVSRPNTACYTDLQKHLVERLGETWDVWNYDWADDSLRYGSLLDDRVEATAELHGQHLARWIIAQGDVAGGYQHVQLIGLSLGSRVADAASIVLRQGKAHRLSADGVPTIHLTFQDAWTPHGWYLVYGSAATWAEHQIYYGDVAANIRQWPLNTDREMPHARSFDVTYDDTGYDGLHNKHSGPIYWYDHTVRTYRPGVNRGFGFDLSKANWPTGWGSEPASTWAAATRVNVESNPDYPADSMDRLSNHAHDRIASVTAAARVAKSNLLPLRPRQDLIESADARTDDESIVLTSGSAPAWASFLVDFTKPANALEFRFRFDSAGVPATMPATSPAEPDGLLSVCIDGKLLTLRRERFAGAEPQSTGDLMLDPADDVLLRPLTGPHMLSFRVDPMFSAARSRVIISDVSASLIQVDTASARAATMP